MEVLRFDQVMNRHDVIPMIPYILFRSSTTTPYVNDLLGRANSSGEGPLVDVRRGLHGHDVFSSITL